MYNFQPPAPKLSRQTHNPKQFETVNK